MKDNNQIKPTGGGKTAQKGKETMKNYPRHRANTPKDIFKEDYNEILMCAKRKHSEEFFLFLTNGWWSESGIDIFGESKEHWIKFEGKWNKM